MTIKIQGDKITFPDNTEQTTAYDGASGGGSTPTPEDLVWENKIDERVLNTAISFHSSLISLPWRRMFPYIWHP